MKEITVLLPEVRSILSSSNVKMCIMRLQLWWWSFHHTPSSAAHSHNRTAFQLLFHFASALQSRSAKRFGLKITIAFFYAGDLRLSWIMSVIWFMQQHHQELHRPSQTVWPAGWPGVWLMLPLLPMAATCGPAPWALSPSSLRGQSCICLWGCRNGWETSGNYPNTASFPS